MEAIKCPLITGREAFMDFVYDLQMQEEEATCDVCGGSGEVTNVSASIFSLGVDIDPCPACQNVEVTEF